MSAPAPVTPEAVEQQRESVTRCLLLIARAFDVNPGFDWPCGCGHRSDQCTKRSDGSCDG